MENSSISQTPNSSELSKITRLSVPFSSAWNSTYQDRSSTGIANPGILCYRNVVLQLLLHTPIFLNFLEHACTDRYRRKFHGLPPSTICLLKDFADAYWAFERSPKDFAKSLQALGPRLAYLYWEDQDEIDVDHQQDALEFLDRCFFQSDLGSEFNSIRDIFKLVTEKQFQCHKCHMTHSKAGLEEQYHLTANLPNGYEHCEVNEAIIPGMQSSTMPRTCDYCKETTEHTIRDSIVRLPEILLVQVNRYDNTGQRLQHDIEIAEYLTVSDCLRDYEAMDSGDATYELYSIIFHHGESIHCGHYTIAVKAPDRMWKFLTDDAEVQTMSTPQELKNSIGNTLLSDAYILVYRRLSPKEEICPQIARSSSASPAGPTRATPREGSPIDADGDSYMFEDAHPANNADDDLDSLFEGPLDFETEESLNFLEERQLYNQLHNQLNAQLNATSELDPGGAPSTEPSPERLHENGGEGMGGETSIPPQPGQMKDPGQWSSTAEVQPEAKLPQPEVVIPLIRIKPPKSMERTPMRERLRPRKKTTTQVMNTKSSSMGVDGAASSRKAKPKANPQAKPRGINKKAKTNKPKAAGKGTRKAQRLSKRAPKKAPSKEVAATHQLAPSEPESWVRRSKRRYKPVNCKELSSSPDGFSSS